jgi:hypothetical protein
MNDLHDNREDDKAALTTLDAHWERRQRRSLLRASDQHAAETLLAEMYRWSARQKRWGDNAGSWVKGMEYLIWQRQPRGFRELYRSANGWWRWCDGVVFISATPWRQLCQAWERREQTRRDYRTAEKTFEQLSREPPRSRRPW